jgi:hypothetical protein
MTDKVIETLPTEIRMKVWNSPLMTELYDRTPWAQTVYLAGVLNDKDALEMAAVQKDETRACICKLIALSGNLPALKWALVWRRSFTRRFG